MWCRLMQDDEQGLDADVDDLEVARLHFWLGSNPPAGDADRLNVPLQVFQLLHISGNRQLSLLPPSLNGMQLIHSVVLSPTSLGLVFLTASDQCISDVDVVATLSAGDRSCSATCSDATFKPLQCDLCRMHWFSYVLTCNA